MSALLRKDDIQLQKRMSTISVKSSRSQQGKPAAVETYYERIMRQKNAIITAHKNYSGSVELKQLVKRVISGGVAY